MEGKDKKSTEPHPATAAAGSAPALASPVKKKTVISKMKGQIMKKGKRGNKNKNDNNNDTTFDSALQGSASFDVATASGVTRSMSWANKDHHHHQHPTDDNISNSLRLRANTDPSHLIPELLPQQQQELLLYNSNDDDDTNHKDNTENPTPTVQSLVDAETNKDKNNSSSTAATSTATTTTKDDTVISTSGISDTVVPYCSSSTTTQNDNDDDDDDEEIRLAKAMAQAIQANPNMTPEEIHKLLGKTTTSTATATTSNQLFNPNYISNLFTTGTTTLMSTATVAAEAAPAVAAYTTMASGISGISNAAGGGGGGGGEIKASSSWSSSDGGGTGKSGNNSKSKRGGTSFRFDGSRLERATRGLLTGSSISTSTRNIMNATTTGTTTTALTSHNTNASQAAAAAGSASSSDSYAAVEQQENNNLLEVASVASEKSGGGGGGLRLSFRQSKATPRSAPTSPNTTTTTTTTTIMPSTINVTHNNNTIMPTSRSNNNKNTNGHHAVNIKPVSTTTTAASMKPPRTTTMATSRSLDENEIAQQHQPQPATAEEPSGSGGSGSGISSFDIPTVVSTTSAKQQSIHRTTMSAQTSMAASSSVAATTTNSAAPTTTATTTTPSAGSMPEKTTTTFTAPKQVSPKTAVSSGPIRLSGLAWKRRGGMGKYSSSGAWERRRIELQGSRLLYYQEETSTGVSPTELAAGLEEIDEGLLVQKRTTWLEQVATATTAAAALATGATTVISTSSSADDPTAPRGYMDLTKDKATVQASWGHSGAPSPFAISIKKPGGETKWKFCFDYHKDQMEWLAALTDVVVQNSVDSYNHMLLEAADPSNQYTITDATPAAAVAAAAILHPYQSVASPPGTLKSAHQLWTMGSYCIGYPFNVDLVEAAKQMVKTAATTTEFPGECDETESPLEEDEAAATDVDIVTTTKSMVVDQDSESNVVDEDIVDDELDAEAQAAAVDAAVKTRILPEQNMALAVAILNVALAFCRSSSTSMEGFWYVVALANATMFLLTIQQPDWKSLVQHVRAARCCSTGGSSSPLGATSTTSQVATSTTKPTRKPSLRQNDKTSEPVASQASASMQQGKMKPPPGFLPLAGATAIKLENTTDKPVNSKGEMFAGWRCPPGETLQVRSHGYSSTKDKVDSPGELYECARVDVFESPSRYPDMAKRVQLPKVDFKDEGPKTWRTPDIIVISIALPTDPPKMGRSSSDGGGYTITMYCTMKQDTRDILRRVTADGYDHSKDDSDNGGDIQKSKVNAVRLLEEWCRRAPTDLSWFSRFKVVPNAHNLKEIGMPSWISKYNGKPFLIKRPGVTGFLHQHPELSCLEFDISIHPFPYLAKQAICFMKESYFKRVLVTFGFVIEGKTDDELPECIIAAMQLCYPDPAYAIMAHTFFAGTCHSSFD